MQRRQFGPVVAVEKAGVVDTVQPESNIGQPNKCQILNGAIAGQDNIDAMLAWSAKHCKLPLQRGSPLKCDPFIVVGWRCGKFVG